MAGFRAAKYTDNDIKRRAGQYLLPQQLIFFLSPRFAGRPHAPTIFALNPMSGEPRQICQLNRSNEYEHALNGQRRPAGRERGANNGLT